MASVDVHTAAALEIGYVQFGADGKSLVSAASAAPRTYLAPFTVLLDTEDVPTALDDLPAGPNGEPVLADVYCDGADGDFVTYWHAPDGDPEVWPGKKLAAGEELATTAPAVLLFELGSGSGDCTLMVEPYYYGGA